MKTLRNVAIGAVLLVMCGLMLMFAILSWVTNMLSIGFAFCTYKIVDDALYLVNKHYLENGNEDPHVNLSNEKES